LRLCCLTVCGLLLSLLLCVLFGKVSTHNAATDRTDHSMVASVVSGDPADDSAFDASFGLGCAQRAERDRGRENCGDHESHDRSPI